MNMTEFLEKLKLTDYDEFENQTILSIIKYCDTKTREVFFPDAEPCCKFKNQWKAVSIKLVGYTMHLSKNNKFNEISGIRDITYSHIGKYLYRDRQLWNDVFFSFIKNLNPDFNPAFADEFYENTITEQFVHFTCMQAEQFPQLPFLCFNIIHAYKRENYDQYCSKWREYSHNDNLVDLFARETYFSNYFQSQKLVSGIAKSVEDAMNLRTNYEATYQAEYTPDGHGVKLIWHEIYDTGLAVCEWLKSENTRSIIRHIRDIPNVHTDKYSG